MSKVSTPSAFGPVQLANHLGLRQFQLDRARAKNLVPAPDRAGGRWSRALVEQLAPRVEEIRAAVGSVCDGGAVYAAELLSHRLSITVPTDAVIELAALGILPTVGTYKGWPLYCGQTLEKLTDPAVIEAAARTGKLRTADEAAQALGIRRTDFDYLTRAGWLTPASYGFSSYQRRSEGPTVPLYRARDLDALLALPELDWSAVRAAPKGSRSLFADLPCKASQQ